VVKQFWLTIVDLPCRNCLMALLRRDSAKILADNIKPIRGSSSVSRELAAPDHDKDEPSSKYEQLRGNHGVVM
jgi:hypothetical protein